MCGRKTLTKGKVEIIQELLVDEWDESFHWEPSYNIAPTQTTPVLVQWKTKYITQMRWGLVPSWSKDMKLGSKLINARSETLREKPSYRNLLSSKRCAVLSDGYFEWQQSENGKQPFYIHHPRNKLLPLAGLWDVWEDDDNKKVYTYTVITTTPADSISFIHNRMPVILNEDAMHVWINPETPKEKAMKYLLPFGGSLGYYPVSTYVNSPFNNSKACITPIHEERS